MASLMDGMTGIVTGSVFGGIFILTCLISSIKAIRDRRRIKRNIAEKEKHRQENGGDIEDKAATKLEPAVINGVTTVGEPSAYQLPVPSFSVKDGVDNLTFKHSNADIKCSNENEKERRRERDRDRKFPPKKSNRSQSAENVSNKKRTVPRTVSGEEQMNGIDSIRVAHLSSECLAVKKYTRRHSYEVAVAENSWLPTMPPNFASSETIMNTYRYGCKTSPISSSTTCFENRAYDSEDYKTAKRTNRL